MSIASTDNHLLRDFDFPPFDVIEAKHVRPGIRALLKQTEEALEVLEKTVEPTWPKLVEPLEKIPDRLNVVWSAVVHLKSVKDSPELRSAIEEVQPEKVAFDLKFDQSKPIYNAFKAIRESPDWDSLSDARKRIVESKIKEAVLSGIALEDYKREQFNKIEQDLAKLSQKFEENVLDSTNKFAKLITAKKDIDGLPATALGLAAQTAVSKGHENATAEDGPWIITLDEPSYMSVMKHAKNRTLREEVYRAFISRASNGDLDNTEIINQILKLRLEKAKLLGYSNYAEVSMAMKMASVEKVEELLEKIRSASWDAVRDLVDLKEFCKSQGSPEADDLNHWDITFWSERFRESKYELNEEELRPYLSLPRVMDGLFNLLRFATGDLELHAKYVLGGSESIYCVDQRVSKRTQVLPPLPDDKYLASFCHIFAGGYTAGYYSYMWAEVLSADAFSAFEDVGLENEKAVKETGQRFRQTVLALGGGKAPLEVFVLFRGREPSPEALLRHHGPQILPMVVVELGPIQPGLKPGHRLILSMELGVGASPKLWLLTPQDTSQTQAQVQLNGATSHAPLPIDRPIAAIGQSKDLKSFMDLKTPEFDATPFSVEPQKFLDRCEKILTTLGLRETRGVEFTTFLFSGTLKAWWTFVLRRRQAGLPPITWSEFSAMFMDRFIPLSKQDDMRRQFYELQKESMTVTEYEAKFTKLSRMSVMDPFLRWLTLLSVLSPIMRWNRFRENKKARNLGGFSGAPSEGKGGFDRGKSRPT
ncbi:Organellar oligopeptidase A, chloroplastic/mitochondrial [Capsicum chinense]|nr:Organellar oligopeptidase A, chloroplastic/mitochondrial [Capsicum chinense]